MKIKVITFASESHINWALELRESFKYVENPLEFTIYTPEDLHMLFDQNKDILKFKKGYGNMFWKGPLIHKVSKDMDNGDILIYLDADFILNEPVNFTDMTNEILRKEESIFFKVGEAEQKGYFEKFYTKKELLDYFEVDPHSGSGMNPQIMSGAQFYYINEPTREFITKYAEISLVPGLISDEFDPDQQIDGFVDHRHDQSILSTLINYKILTPDKFTILDDPTQFGPKETDSKFTLRGLVGQSPGAKPFKVSIICPVTGPKYIQSIIQSVNCQTYMNVELIFVIDFPTLAKDIQEEIERVKSETVIVRDIRVMTLPYNTGRNNWNGHRIYAAIPHILPFSDYISNLDEDNTIEPDHITELMSVINKGNKWAYTLRNIISQSGDFICQDSCESLGAIARPWNGAPSLVDTNCYLIPRAISIQVSYVWNCPARPEGGPEFEADRQLFKILSEQVKPFGCTYKHTLNYRVGNRPDSVQAEFFLKGNEFIKGSEQETKDSSLLFGKRNGVDKNRSDELQLLQTQTKETERKRLYLFHFTPDATAEFLARPLVPQSSQAFDNWEPNTISELRNRFELIDGYKAERNGSIPSNSVILVQICLPECLPMETLKRNDIKRIGYTVEGPNIRHKNQWSFRFLDNHFDVLLTYFEPLLQADKLKSKRIFCPYLCRLNLNFEADRSLLITNQVYDRSIGMVLENRGLSGIYKIETLPDAPDIQLECLDHLRAKFASGLPMVTVYGKNWEQLSKEGKVNLGANKGKFADDLKTIDHYKNHTFALIIENCYAEGYVSEKIYDALIAGCIPIYYGYVSDRMREIIPDDIYIDAKKMPIVNLKKILQEIGIKEIIRYKKTIQENRESIIRKADSTFFANLVSSVF